MKTTTQDRRPTATVQPAPSISGAQAVDRVDNGRQPAVQSQLDSASRLGHRFDAVDVKTTLRVGAPDDRYEQEARRAAQHVTDQLGDGSKASNTPVPRLTPLTRSPLIASPAGQITAQRNVVGHQSAGGPVATDIAAKINVARGDGQQLPAHVRAPMEQAFGFRFDQVRVHSDDRARGLNQKLGSRAFAVGGDIFFSHPDPLPAALERRQSDDELDRLTVLGEELAHVVQQTRGGVQAIQRGKDGTKRKHRRRRAGTDRRHALNMPGAPANQPGLNRPIVPPLDLSRLNRPVVPPLDLSQLNRPANAAAPAGPQQAATDKPSSAEMFVGAADYANARLGPVADIGGTAATLADRSLSLPKTSDNSWQGGSDAWTGGATYNDYASADPSALGIAAGPLGFAGLLGLPGAISKQAEGIEDVFEGLSGPDKDYRRAIEGAGTIAETAASNYSTLLNATDAATKIAWTGARLAGSGAAEGAGQVLTAVGQIAPGIGVVTGGIGTIKGAYQGITAQSRMNTLTDMAAQGNQNGTRRMLINYALENQRKQRNRAIINTTSSALGTAGSAISLSGVGAGIGASVSGSGLALKYGAAGVRMAKQSLRDRRAKRISSGKSGPLGKLTDKLFDPDVQKTSALKKLKRDLMTEALVGGGAQHADIFEAMGANKAQLRLLNKPNRNPEEQRQLAKIAHDLFKKRE